MHAADHERIAGLAKKKFGFLDTSLGGYLLLSAMAGIYLGFGIALIFSLGGPLAAAGSPFVKLIMGASFGIALTLVIFAGSELFTGNNMVGAIGGLSRSVSWSQVAQFKEGKQQVVGYLVGQVMKTSGGKANPGKVNELLKKKLG